MGWALGSILYVGKLNLNKIFFKKSQRIWINKWTCIFSKYFVCIANALSVVFSGDDKLVFVQITMNLGDRE